jgi:hypothetical protein
LTGTLPPELGDLSELTRLILDSNQLGGSLPPELGDLGEMTILSLWGN